MNGNGKGYTLVELIVVVVVIGILIAVALPVYYAIDADARHKVHNANVRVLESVAAMYIVTNPGTELAEAECRTAFAGYVPNWPENPLETGEYTVKISRGGIVTVFPPKTAD